MKKLFLQKKFFKKTLFNMNKKKFADLQVINNSMKKNKKIKKNSIKVNESLPLVGFNAKKVCSIKKFLKFWKDFISIYGFEDLNDQKDINYVDPYKHLKGKPLIS